MTQKNYFLITGIVFLIVALVHLLRILQGWGIVIDEMAIPMWVSWAGLVIPGILAYYGLRLGLSRQ